MGSTLLAWLLAVLLGARHASEPDHVAAVGTLLAAEPASSRRTVALGASWGLGHAVALVAVGAVLLVSRLEMPGRVGDGFEAGVAALLLVLGGRSLWRAWRGRKGAAGVQAHEHEHVHERGVVRGGVRRTMAVGLVHGLAGSGAVTALALASMPTVAAGLGYMCAFAAGSVLGMAALTGLAGMPLRSIASKPRAQAALAGVAGMVSVVLGLGWGVPVVRRLFGLA